MDIKELLFRKYFNQGNYYYECGDYVDAYINYQKASAYEKTRLIYLLIARTLYYLNHYKQAFENIQIAIKLSLEKDNADYLQELRNKMIKIMTPDFVLPTINEETALENFEQYDEDDEDTAEISETESSFNRSIDSEKKFYPEFENSVKWIEENLPEPALVEDDCTEDLLLEHLWKLEDDDDHLGDGWSSDSTFTGSDSDSNFDTDVENNDKKKMEDNNENAE